MLHPEMVNAAVHPMTQDGSFMEKGSKRGPDAKAGLHHTL